jgi:hypothetical protein
MINVLLFESPSMTTVVDFDFILENISELTGPGTLNSGQLQNNLECLMSEN